MNVTLLALSRCWNSINMSFLSSLGLRFLLCAKRINSVLLTNWQ